MVKAKFWETRANNTQLKTQLMLASANQEIREDVVLKRLVTRAGHRLKVSGDSVTVSRQIAVDLGYYLFCHHYRMPRAAYDLLAVAQAIDANQRASARVVEFSSSKQ